METNLKSNTTEIDAGGIIFAGRRYGHVDPKIKPQQVQICRRFLERCKRTKTGRVVSYSLKHVIERANGWPDVYVSNGACIQAALDLGLTVTPIIRRWVASPNAMIGDPVAASEKWQQVSGEKSTEGKRKRSRYGHG